MKKLAGIDFGALEAEAAPHFAGKNIGFVVTKLIPYFLLGAGILLLIYLVMGGFQLMTSLGNPKVVEVAKAKITYSLLGFVIVLVAVWIVQIVGLLFGIDVIGEVFPF